MEDIFILHPGERILLNLSDTLLECCLTPFVSLKWTSQQSSIQVVPVGLLVSTYRLCIFPPTPTSVIQPDSLSSHRNCIWIPIQLVNSHSLRVFTGKWFVNIVTKHVWRFSLTCSRDVANQVDQCIVTALAVANKHPICYSLAYSQWMEHHDDDSHVLAIAKTQLNWCFYNSMDPYGVTQQDFQTSMNSSTSEQDETQMNSTTNVNAMLLPSLSSCSKHLNDSPLSLRTIITPSSCNLSRCVWVSNPIKESISNFSPTRLQWCSSYPRYFCQVPLISSKCHSCDMALAIGGRIRHRLLAVSMSHPTTGAMAFRSSQPRFRGASTLERQADIACLSALRNLPLSSTTASYREDPTKVLVLDLRSLVSATANAATKGAGFESSSDYQQVCTVTFGNLPNIFAVQHAFSRLAEVVMNDGMSYSTVLQPSTAMETKNSSETFTVTAAKRSVGYQQRARVFASEWMHKGLHAFWATTTSSSSSSMDTSKNLIHQSDYLTNNKQVEVWSSFIQRVLQAASRVATCLETGSQHVLVHCSDGWDRTPLVLVLTGLLLSPHSRTIKGFCAALDREFCAFGHPFATRYHNTPEHLTFEGINQSLDDEKTIGQCLSQLAQHQRIHSELSETLVEAAVDGCVEENVERGKKPDESSPVFQLFLESVWQCVEQHPDAFEFDARLLRFLSIHVYSGYFGTFLCDNEQERISKGLPCTTLSIWSVILAQQDQFVNPLYHKHDTTKSDISHGGSSTTSWHRIHLDVSCIKPWCDIWTVFQPKRWTRSVLKIETFPQQVSVDYHVLQQQEEKEGIFGHSKEPTCQELNRFIQLWKHCMETQSSNELTVQKPMLRNQFITTRTTNRYGKLEGNNSTALKRCFLCQTNFSFLERKSICSCGESFCGACMMIQSEYKDGSLVKTRVCHRCSITRSQ